MEPKEKTGITAREILANPAHPLFNEVEEFFREELNALAHAGESGKIGAMKKGDFIPTLERIYQEMQAADERAEAVIESIYTLSHKDVKNMPPVDFMTMLSIIDKMDEKTTAKARFLLRERSIDAARRKRPKKEHPKKKMVLDYFQQWQNNPALYSSKSEFLRDMEEKTEINRRETLRAWIKPCLAS